MLYGGMNGGGIPGGPIPIGAAAMKPGGIAPGVKPIWDVGGNAGGGIIGGAILVFMDATEFGESWWKRRVVLKNGRTLLNGTVMLRRPFRFLLTIGNGGGSRFPTVC